jgi:hypothetical protein
MSRSFKTEIDLSKGLIGGDEFIVEVPVEYDRYAGFAGDRTDPPEGARVEICDIVTRGGAPVSDRFYTDEELLAECMEDWIDDAIAAEEYCAEQRRDDEMMERWA